MILPVWGATTATSDVTLALKGLKSRLQKKNGLLWPKKSVDFSNLCGEYSTRFVREMEKDFLRMS